VAYRGIIQEICHGTNAAGTTRGIIPAALIATQVPGPLTGGAIDVSFPFRILSQAAMLLVAFVKGSETSVQFGMQIFGADARLVEDATYIEKTDHTSDTLGQRAPFITGTAYPLNASSLTNTPWVCPASAPLTATQTAAFPIHFGAAPGVLPGFCGDYARLAINIVGAVNATTTVHVEIAWGDIT